MPSADVERAAEVAVTARTQNAGQSCIAAKRFIVHTDVYDAFAERFTEGMRALKVGDPMDEGTYVGPLSSEQGLNDLVELVDDAVRGGATVLCGGECPDGSGWYYPRPCWRTSPASCASTARRPSARSPRSTGRPTWTRRC
ncbi:NAD/NADP-dependent betaine aldehyde dehydrogenase [Streptomyces tendae]